MTKYFKSALAREAEAVSDAQVQRVLGPVLNLIKAGAFDRPEEFSQIL